MSRRKFTVGCIDADGICTSQTPAGAGNLILNGALTSIKPDTGAREWIADAPRLVTITSAGNDTGKNFTITGIAAGIATSETLAGANATAKAFVTVWDKIISISVDAATAGAVTVGTTAVVQTPWYPTDIMQVPFNASIFVMLTSATVVYSVQHTPDDVQDLSVTPRTLPNSDLTSKTANGDTNYFVPVSAVRCSMTGFTAGSLDFIVEQAGPAGS